MTFKFHLINVFFTSFLLAFTCIILLPLSWIYLVFFYFLIQNPRYYQSGWKLLDNSKWKMKSLLKHNVYNGPLNCPQKQFRLHSFKVRMLDRSKASVQVSFIAHYTTRRLLLTREFDSVELTKFWTKFWGVLGHSWK